MKNFKRIIALVLALTLVFAMALPMAASAEEVDTYNAVEDYLETGNIAETNAATGLYQVATTKFTTANGAKYDLFYPSNAGANETFPAIAWANGTACVTSLYSNFLKYVASMGYIVIANTTVMAGDGTAQSEAVNTVIALNSDSTSPLYNHVAIDKIGAMGHSQGGKSTVNAAVMNDKIKTIISIAGASNASDTKALKIPSFFMGGTLDGMVMPSLWVKPAYNNCPSPAVYALLKGAEHCACMFYPGKLQVYVVAWFDAFLKDDANALALFTTPGAGLQADKNWTDVMTKGF